MFWDVLLKFVRKLFWIPVPPPGRLCTVSHLVMFGRGALITRIVWNTVKSVATIRICLFKQIITASKALNYPVSCKITILDGFHF